MTTQIVRGGPIALLGYSVDAMEAARTLGYRFVMVVPPGFDEYVPEGIATVTWEFDRFDDRSSELLEKLEVLGCRLSVPLYEETVEWAGALNTSFLHDPRRFAKVMLLRDKAMMKRKAQMAGIRVGAFQEVDDAEELRKFFRRVNEAAARIVGDEPEPVHVKPLRAAGSVGHRFLRKPQQIADIPEDGYPLLAESHLGGQEFSVEAFVHDGRIHFMNIDEYVHLGYTQHTPAGPGLEEQRAKIKKQVEKLIKAFDIRYGVIHPEYFLDENGEIAVLPRRGRGPQGLRGQLPRVPEAGAGREAQRARRADRAPLLRVAHDVRADPARRVRPHGLRQPLRHDLLLRRRRGGHAQGAGALRARRLLRPGG